MKRMILFFDQMTALILSLPAEWDGRLNPLNLTLTDCGGFLPMQAHKEHILQLGQAPSEAS